MGKEEDIKAQLDSAETSISSGYIDITEWLQGRRSIAELITLIEQRRLDDILTTEELRQAAQRLANTINTAYADSADAVASELSRILDSRLDFDLTNHWAVERTKNNSLRLIRDITQEQRETIRDALTASAEQGLNPLQTAKMIRGSIGLTSSQVDAVANYREALSTGSSAALDYDLRDKRSDSAVESAIAGDKSLTEPQIDKMVNAYQQRYVNYRATVISRTEGLRAVHEGSADMWRQATVNGDVEAAHVQRTWRTAHRPNTRSSHRAMDGQQRKLGEAFESGDGVALMYPGDPNAPADETVCCRCVVITRIRR